MAIIKLNTNPSANELKWFGLMLLLIFGIIGGVVLWYTGSYGVPAILWSIGSALCVVYYALRPIRLPLYIAWMRLVYPIGWTISFTFFIIMYYGLFSPIGLMMRIFRYDPMQRRLNRDAPTYWVKHDTDTEPSRYFRQF
jgi:hypothetical protein